MGYQLDYDRVPQEAGVYLFGRCFGSQFEALYVGQAQNLRGRVKGQLNNLRLVQHLRDARNGQRVVFAGVVQPKRGQQLETCMTLAERCLIRHFLSEGHDLVNVQGARIRRHVVASRNLQRNRRFWPKEMYLDSK